MKIIPFPGNDRNFKINYYRTREGPNWFLCYYKHASTGQTDPLQAWRTIGVAKFTDTGKALKAWCLEMDELYGPKDYTDEEKVDEFFDHSVEPSDNTKMVV